MSWPPFPDARRGAGGSPPIPERRDRRPDGWAAHPDPRSAFRSIQRRLLLVALLPLVLVGGGAVGYRCIEGWSVFDAVYMAVITLTTVGFGEVHPLSGAGRLFTIALTLGGVFTLFFATTEVLRLVVTGELGSHLRRRRMDKKIDHLERHVIVCGYGRVGRQVCLELSQAEVRFVVVEREASRLANFQTSGGHPLVGDATEDGILQKAGISRARAVVAAAASDADNLFVTMTARLLNDQIPIVARADDEASVPKLMRAGATKVISLYAIGGGRVAQAVLRPAVLDFIEVATRSEHLDLQIEEIPLGETGALHGKSIADSGFREQLGLILVAVKQRKGHMVFNPPNETRLRAGDTLIVMGRREQLDSADRLAKAPAP